jgi:dTDP-4-dehydrorhamnose reductase
MSNASIWILGKTGQLAQCFADSFKNETSATTRFLGRDEIDFEHDLFEQLSELNEIPDVIINAVAYTAVDKAESEEELAHRVNAEAVSELADFCALHDIVLMHFSTDYVFNGEKNSPYTEDDECNPLGVYGKTKREGELAVLECETGIVIRLSWLYSNYGKNFYLTMKNAMASDPSRELRVVSDQLGCPTDASDVSNSVSTYILKGLNEETEWTFGLFHFTGNEVISWYDFAVRIKNEFGFSNSILPISTSGYPTAAKRPAYSVLGSVRKLFLVREVKKG